MRKARQVTGLLMVDTMASAALVGCTDESAPSSTSQAEAGKDSAVGSGAPTASGDQITLRPMWWGGDGRNEATLAVTDQYRKLHPEVRTEAEMNSDQGYIDKASTMLANGTAPDILQQNVDSLLDFMSRGDFFVDFYEHKDTFDTPDSDETFVSQFGTSDGKPLALPTGMSCLATAVNRNAAEACGVDLTKQITWDSTPEDGKKLHAENPDYYYLNTDTKIFCEHVLRSYLRQVIGESFIIDSERRMSFTRGQLVEAFTYIKDCYDGGVFEPAEDSATLKGQIHTSSKWMDGKLALAYGLSSSTNLLMDAIPEVECTVVQMPVTEDRANNGSFADTPQYMAVNKSSEHVEETVDFLNYLYNSAEVQEMLKDVRPIPPTSTARQLCADKGLLNQTMADAMDLVAGLNDKSDKGYTTSAEVYAIQKGTIESTTHGQGAPEEAADDVIELTNNCLSGLS